MSIGTTFKGNSIQGTLEHWLYVMILSFFCMLPLSWMLCFSFDIIHKLDNLLNNYHQFSTIQLSCCFLKLSIHIAEESSPLRASLQLVCLASHYLKIRTGLWKYAKILNLVPYPRPLPYPTKVQFNSHRLHI